MLTTIANFIPKLVLFAVILVIGWIVAKVLRNVLARVLARVGFDRVGERGGINRYLGKYTASTAVALLVYYAVLLFALQLGFGVFGPNPVSTMINGIVGFLPKAFVAIVIVIIAAAIARVVKDIIVNALGTLSYGKVLGTIAQVFILAMGIIAALNQIHVATSVITPLFVAALAIIAGVAIVGVGGGLIGPMRERWERMLNRAESEVGTVREVRSRSAQHDVQREGARPGVSGGQPQHAAAPTSAGQPGMGGQPGAGRPGMGQPGMGGQTGMGAQPGMPSGNPPTDPGYGRPPQH
ncbi:mechanosensitive ion channel family protein [Actinocatenispora rupis]